MAIMNSEGEIEQVGTPEEIYEFPRTSFVAKFVGTTNILKGNLCFEGEKTYVVIEGLGKFEALLPKNKKWACNGCDILMSLRPEKIEINKIPQTGFSNCLEGRVDSIVYHGRSTQYYVKLKNGFMMHVFEQNEVHFPQEEIDYDDKVYMYWQKENVVLLEK
jgi:ABC-type Fe3+/spermidine/putrescine transport system ATPase subunit